MAVTLAQKKSPVFDWEHGEFMTDINGKVLVVGHRQPSRQRAANKIADDIIRGLISYVGYF